MIFVQISKWLSLLSFGLILFASPVHAQEKVAEPFRPIEDDADLPRVLILGDSISIGYTLDARRLLEGQANVHRAAENCGPTTRGLQRLSAWLGDEPWDVIHFNFGLHDLKYMDAAGKLVKVENGKQQVPPTEYEKNLRELCRHLKATNAKLIWGATTPVPEGAQGRIVGDAKAYNEVAARVVAEELGEIATTNDLYAFCMPRLTKIQRPANVHFTKDGSAQLAGQVAEAIRERLEQ